MITPTEYISKKSRSVGFSKSTNLGGDWGIGWAVGV
jgi:hypothetical protein